MEQFFDILFKHSGGGVELLVFLSIIILHWKFSLVGGGWGGVLAKPPLGLSVKRVSA